MRGVWTNLIFWGCKFKHDEGLLNLPAKPTCGSLHRKDMGEFMRQILKK
jgi:hypothetical protein